MNYKLAFLILVFLFQSKTAITNAQNSVKAKVQAMEILSAPSFNPLDQLSRKDIKMVSLRDEEITPSLNQLKGTYQFDEMKRIASLFKKEAQKAQKAHHTKDLFTLWKDTTKGIDQIQPHLKPFKGCRLHFLKNKKGKTLCTVNRSAYVVPIGKDKKALENLKAKHDLSLKIPLDNSMIFSQHPFYRDSENKMVAYSSKITNSSKRKKFIEKISKKKNKKLFSSPLISHCIRVIDTIHCKYLERHPLKNFNENCFLTLDVTKKVTPDIRSQIEPTKSQKKKQKTVLDNNHSFNLICHEGDYALIYSIDSGCSSKPHKIKEIRTAAKSSFDLQGYFCYKEQDALYLENYKLFLSSPHGDPYGKSFVNDKIRKYGISKSTSSKKSQSRKLFNGTR